MKWFCCIQIETFTTVRATYVGPQDSGHANGDPKKFPLINCE